MSIPVKLDENIPLSLMLLASDNDKVVKCSLTTFFPRTIWVEDVLLTARGDGIYDNSTYLMPNKEFVIARFDVFESDGVTSAGYSRTEEIFVLDKISQQYNCRMTTVFNAISTQEVLAWIEKDGQTVANPTSCACTVKNSEGAIVWSKTSESPNADGIFKFSNLATGFVSDANYYVTITIEADGETRSSTQTFITVG
jgi:hypothetical protein